MSDFIFFFSLTSGGLSPQLPLFAPVNKSRDSVTHFPSLKHVIQIFS